MISLRPSYCLTRMGKSPRSSWVRSWVGRRMSRSLYGRSLDELAELVAVPLGPAHVAPALHDEQLGLLAAQIQPIAVHDAAVDDEVVALAIGQVAEHRLQRAAPLAHVDQLVGLRVPVEVGVVLVRLDVKHGHFLVEEQRDPVERGAAALLDLARCGSAGAGASGRGRPRISFPGGAGPISPWWADRCDTAARRFR